MTQDNRDAIEGTYSDPNDNPPPDDVPDGDDDQDDDNGVTVPNPDIEPDVNPQEAS